MSESTKPKPFCFVLMPFSDDFKDIYELGIKAACTDAGAYCERVDEQYFPERILDRIYNQISKADIIIADMTGKNPNVFYEVGYAHALGKSTILLTQSADDIPFDFRHFTHIIYQKKITLLKKKLTERIIWSIENPGEKSEEKIAIDIYQNGKEILNHTSIIGTKSHRGPGLAFEINLTIFNNSNTMYLEGDFRIGFIFSENFTTVGNYFGKGDFIIADLPNGAKSVVLPHFERLFPQSYASFRCTVFFKEFSQINSESFIIRLFLKSGIRDYNLSLVVK